MKKQRLAVLIVPTVLTLAGCGGSGSEPQPAAQAPPPVAGPAPAIDPWTGRFIGTVTIGGEAHFADALLTQDGEVRMHLSVTGLWSGALGSTRNPGAVQFAGQFTVQQDTIAGGGQVLGEGCVDPGNGRFCDAPGSGEISLRFNPNRRTSDLEGELRVATTAGVEIWPVVLEPWHLYYDMPTKQGDLRGAWTELMAEFVADGEAIISVDNLGNLFFQSAETGCTGNGSVAPHLDGRFTVHDLALTVASCGGVYAYLNGEYQGLATLSPTNYWGYDAALRAWLTKESGSASPAAMTMWAPYIY
jgi:hypothetical protein